MARHGSVQRGLRACARIAAGGALAILTFFLGLSVAGAQTCLEPSPSLLAGKDPYGPIDARDLGAGELETLRELFAALDGEWSGSASETRCRSVDDPADHETTHYELDARADADHFGNLTLTVHFFAPEDRTRHKEIVRLFTEKGRLRMESNTSAGDVQILDLTGGRLAFFQRMLFQAGSGGGSTRREIHIAIARRPGGFSLERRIYVQARLSAFSVWEFHR